MKPPRFDYVRAESLAEALDVLSQEGDAARVLAGGQSLLPMLNMRLARPAVLVDIMHLAELGGITDHGSEIRIGAAVRQAELERHKALACLPLLARALPLLGHAQTRSRGTLCGSVAHADPSAEIPLVLVALGGVVHLRARRRRRRVPAADFFTGMMSTVRAPDELIAAISLPAAAPGSGHAFREVARRHGDFAIVAAAAIADGDGVRLAIGGVADRPVARVMPAQSTALDDALDEFAAALDARDDLHATGFYRRAMVRRLGRAVIEEAQSCRV